MVHKDSERARRVSEATSESDEEDFFVDSVELPEDFVPEWRGGETEDRSFEQTVPIEHFTRSEY